LISDCSGVLFSQFATTVKSQKCQVMWFMTGVRKYSWHATTLCVNKLFFRWNGYWKHFGYKTVKNRTCQFMLFLCVYQKPMLSSYTTFFCTPIYVLK